MKKIFLFFLFFSINCSQNNNLNISVEESDCLKPAINETSKEKKLFQQKDSGCKLDSGI